MHTVLTFNSKTMPRQSKINDTAVDTAITATVTAIWNPDVRVPLENTLDTTCESNWISTIKSPRIDTSFKILHAMLLNLMRMLSFFTLEDQYIFPFTLKKDTYLSCYKTFNRKS